MPFSRYSLPVRWALTVATIVVIASALYLGLIFLLPFNEWGNPVRGIVITYMSWPLFPVAAVLVPFGLSDPPVQGIGVFLFLCFEALVTLFTAAIYGAIAWVCGWLWQKKKS